MRTFPTDIKTIVLKVSTQMITDGVAEIHCEKIQAFVKEVSELIRKGYKVIVVSSGAIGCGLAKLGLKKRPKDYKKLQALASVGQIRLMSIYQSEFDKYGLQTGQILLSADDMKDSTRRANVRNTLSVLLDKGIVPIINENDSVAIEELSYGDNDKLSALVSVLLFVDLLIILTDVEGLFDKNPKLHENSKIISNVKEINKDLEKVVEDIDEGITFGGMKSKINAIKKLTNIGIPAIVTSFNNQNILERLLSGEELGTYFAPQK
ncbi:MAG: glutamate 5-kinase [Candidatus Lokiarchaeota archaeon]|nr:glutamate 5-kinase [Candidatus Lokiarchaeota archaeon]MBD3340389.1 glutamate 5-kinase [Candidatus Lokiarchaeota archaeon]